jgi:hypothetical protein
MRRLAGWLIAAMMPLCAYAQSGNVITGRVVGIADGDTLTLLTDSHRQVRIRLAEIDAPESGQPWGNRSKTILSQLVFSKTVSVTTRGVDQYGRTSKAGYGAAVQCPSTACTRAFACQHSRFWPNVAKRHRIRLDNWREWSVVRVCAMARKSPSSPLPPKP